MNSAPLSPKVAKKRETILAVSLATFCHEGFAGTDVQVIADKAHVGKGTVYRHFGNKEQLFLATANYCQQQIALFVIEELGGETLANQLAADLGAVEALRRIATAVAKFYEQTPEAVEIMTQERAQFRESVVPTHLMFRAERREGIDQVIEEAISKGEMRAVDVKQATDAYADLIYGSVLNGCLAGGQRQLVERVNAAIEIFLAGLANPATTRKV